jgi:glycosyltransferase involved in cell wall biosynthesis
VAGTREVTLVMPVWRPDPAWFQTAVAGALGQLGCDLEVVVVDDGNAEPVENLLVEIDDPRLRILRTDHGGVSAARNAGTAVASGRHVRYVDADDVLVPDGTQRLLARADGHTIVYGATQVCDEQLEPLQQIRSDVTGDATAACLLGHFDVRHVSMLIPTDVARAAGGWDREISVCEDWDFVLRCLELAPVAAIPDVVTLYRRHQRSATRGVAARDAARNGQRRVIEKYLERHPEARSALGREAWTAHHLAWARRSLTEGAVRSFVADAVALTRVAPSISFGVWKEAAAHAARRGLAGARRSVARPANR